MLIGITAHTKNIVTLVSTQCIMTDAPNATTIATPIIAIVWMNAKINGTETNGLYNLNLNIEPLFDLKIAVVLQGQFEGNFAGMCIIA